MSLEMVESLIYGINLLKRMSKSQRKEINIGLIDLFTFNLIHFTYNILYSIKDDSSNSKSKKIHIKFSNKQSSKLRIVLKELFIISKINIKWFIFIIRHI